LTDWEEYMKAERFITDEDSFNITDRIIQLFPLIDVSPQDERVSAQELVTWHLNQGMKQMLHRTEREMQFHDKNKDGLISFSEYEPPRWANTLHDGISHVLLLFLVPTDQLGSAVCTSASCCFI
jgi:calumenin